MSQTRFPWIPLAILILIGLLMLGGFAIYRISWLEGYQMGQLAAAGITDGRVMPYAAYRPGCGGVLLTLGAIFLLLLIVGKLFRFWTWKTAWGPGGGAGGSERERWVRHWHAHRPHGPIPPWCWGWEEPAEEKAEKPETDADAGNAEAKAEA
jgi:hypothetical protein